MTRLETTTVPERSPVATGSAPRGTSASARWAPRAALVGANLVAVAAFAWPLLGAAAPEQARAAVPWLAFGLLPLALVAAGLVLDRAVASTTTFALLGILTALGAAARILGTGVGGIEVVFVLLVLAGRAYGARFGYLLGLCVVALSSIATGFGPWTPFQMAACAWVGAGAGLLPRSLPWRGAPVASRGAPVTSRGACVTSRGACVTSRGACVTSRGACVTDATSAHRTTTRPRARRLGEVAMLAGYGVVASYLFGAVMNLWFWPFAVGGATSISYAPGAGVGANLASFTTYTLATSTLTFDTVRALTTAIGLVAIGPAALAALRRVRLPR